jgi:hypothetical protein
MNEISRNVGLNPVPVKLNFTGPSLLPQDSVFTTNFDRGRF